MDLSLNMKNWTWKQWTALGVIAAVVIAAVVCHLVQPEVTYAWLEIVSAATFALGIGVGVLLCNGNIVKKNEKKLLTD
jgi:fucose permease